MSKENEKVGALTDDEIEKATGGGDAEPASKKCLNCGCRYEFNLGKCPACGSYKHLLVLLS